MKLKSLLTTALAVFAAIPLAARADETNTFYTVTVDSGTYSEPVSLNSLDVTVEKPGEAAAVKSFAEASADFASGPAIFRKRGSGWMMSSIAMAQFTGEIRVEAGAFMVNTNLMTGPMALTTAPTVVVSNGASFALAATKTTCEANKLKLYNNFRLAGEGVDGFGAVANMLGNSQNYLFYGNWTLDGDAALSGNTRQRWDFAGGSGRHIYLNGHTLTAKKGVGGEYWTFCIAEAAPEDGNIVVDGINLLVQGGNRASARWAGGAENILTFTNGAMLSFYNNCVSIPWTVRFCEGTTFSSGGSNKELHRSDVGYTNNYNYLPGPVELTGSTRFLGSYPYAGFPVSKLKSGLGPLAVQKAWLSLVDPGDYLGPISVNGTAYSDSDVRAAGSGIALYSPLAYGELAAGASLTNASLRLMTDAAYHLPRMDFNVPAGTNATVSGGYASTCVSMKKTGAGALDMSAHLSVTGRLELAGGTLRFNPASAKKYYSANGGLWKCVVPQDDTATHHDFMERLNTTFYSNEVVTCCDMLKTPTYPPWQQYTSVAWGGYVWNRSPTNETWRFALSISGYSKLWIDDVFQSATDDNQAVVFCNVEMTPGPHKFLFKVNPRNYNHPGSSESTRNPDWASGTPGLMVSRTSLVSTNSEDFVFLENGSAFDNATDGGDGSVFTRDAKDVGDYTTEELERAASSSSRPVPNIACKPGTTIDLGEGNESPLFVDRFEGVTSVTNGGLKVAERWRLAAASVQDGGALRVDGKLEFADGCALEWQDLSDLPRKGVYTIAAATGGIVGLPSWKPAADANSKEKYWRLEKVTDASGVETLVFYRSVGAVIIVR